MAALNLAAKFVLASGAILFIVTTIMDEFR